MDKLAKIDLLRERANVTYEEAKAALDQTNDDLLDAMVLLEKQGKVKTPSQSTYSTEYSEQSQYIRVQDKVDEQKRSAPTFHGSAKRIIKGFFSLIFHSSFRISRKEKLIFSLPTWIIAIIVLFSWKAALPIGLAAMLFGVRYSFDGHGRENTDAPNDILKKAGAFAEGVRDEFRKS